jgi:branched-chain amino acid transport system ATP-binding protein
MSALPVNQNAPMLSLRNLSAGYGSFQAISDISLEVQPGEAVAVIGPNGAGKTTLLRAISKLIPATNGNLAAEGRDYTQLPSHQVLSLGIAQVPEHRRLFPQMSVEENLRMGAFLPSARRHWRERLERVYTLFPRMRERRLQAAGTMSGGEQQMCAIGRALMSGPKLLLLDEPSAGLAPVIVQSIFDVVRQMRAEGYTVLIVEQNIHQVLKIVDRAYLLETGRIRRSGSAAELLGSDDLRKAYLGL